jgi:hypothetical protein
MVTPVLNIPAVITAYKFGLQMNCLKAYEKIILNKDELPLSDFIKLWELTEKSE